MKDEDKTERRRAERDPSAPRLQPKRLYQIPDRGIITGIANGVSLFFDINVKIVRAVFVILAIVTHGALAFAYFMLIFIIPVAKTPEDIARAYGRILPNKTATQ